MSKCHVCTCHLGHPPCDSCVNCNCIDHPECENDCQECEIDHHGLIDKPRVYRDKDSLEWEWSCKCPEVPLIIWPVYAWRHAYSLAYTHAKEHHNA